MVNDNYVYRGKYSSEHYQYNSETVFISIMKGKKILIIILIRTCF
jgi:hypothetical protein